MTEAETFEEFFEGHRRQLFGALCLITGNRFEAEEITQEAFVRVWERWDRVAAMDRARRVPVPHRDEPLPEQGAQSLGGCAEGHRFDAELGRPRDGRGSRRGRSRDAAPHAAPESSGRAHRLHGLLERGGGEDPRDHGIDGPLARLPRTIDGPGHRGSQRWTETKERISRAFRLFEMQEPAYELLLRRRARMDWRRRIAAASMGIAIFVVMAVVVRTR